VDHIEALERLARLKESGVLTEAEFQAQKAGLLNGSPPQANVRKAAPSAQSPEEFIEQFRGSTKGWLVGSLAGWMSLLLILAFGLGLVIIFLKWIANISARYELTTQRLMIRTGIIFKRDDEIELFRIKDVRVDYSLINQISGIGTITIRSSDATSGGRDFVMRDIPDARELRETLRNLVDEARQRRGVREIDFDQRYV
jgi:membrane protein YdbS with pleckstrin-like domain